MTPSIQKLRDQNNGQLPAICFPCAVLYHTPDGSELCADCANREMACVLTPWFSEDGLSEDGEPITCDECGQAIDPARRAGSPTDPDASPANGEPQDGQSTPQDAPEEVEAAQVLFQAVVDSTTDFDDKGRIWGVYHEDDQPANEFFLTDQAGGVFKVSVERIS